jgi:CBS domain-containing protein
MKVKDVMTKEVKWVEIPGSRVDALELMKEMRIREIPAVKKGTGELIGIVTLRRLFEKPDEDQLALLVDREVPTVKPDDDLKTAVKVLLNSRVRRLPVLKNGKLVGILSVKDVVERVIMKSNIETPVSELMRPHLIAVWEGTPLKAVLQLIRLSGFRVLPVIDEEGKLLGTVDDTHILSLSDVELASRMSQMTGRSESDSWAWDTEARIYITKKELTVPDKSVSEVMNQDVVRVGKRTPANRAAKLMEEKGVKELLVESTDEKLLGIVRDLDLLKSLLS